MNEPVRPHCRISVAIPAKNEESSIEAALTGFANQRNLDGSPIDLDEFEIVVLANGCSDATVENVARFRNVHPRLAVTTISCELPRDARHVGAARRMALDIAADRQREVSYDGGVIASTDADTIVDPTWIAHALRETRTVDAVAGHVEVFDHDRDRMAAPLRLLYDRERSYQRLRADVEAWLDPQPHDAAPCHDLFVGASFAVRVATYDAAGRLPIVPRLEDFAFARALRRIDARVRHSYDMRAKTSARMDARADGGFATMLASFSERGRRREPVIVENATRTVARARARARLRAFWRNPNASIEPIALCHAYAISLRELTSAMDPNEPFGMSLEAVEATGPPFESLPDEPLESAIAKLRHVRSIIDFDDPLESDVG